MILDPAQEKALMESLKELIRPLYRFSDEILKCCEDYMNAGTIFREMCRIANIVDISLYDEDVFTTSQLAEFMGISKYKTRKAIKILLDIGYIERGSVGRPAIVRGYEYPELVCEAAPPLNGFILTETGKQSEIFKEEWDKSIADIFEPPSLTEQRRV